MNWEKILRVIRECKFNKEQGAMFIEEGKECLQQQFEPKLEAYAREERELECKLQLAVAKRSIRRYGKIPTEVSL